MEIIIKPLYFRFKLNSLVSDRKVIPVSELMFFVCVFFFSSFFFLQLLAEFEGYYAVLIICSHSETPLGKDGMQGKIAELSGKNLHVFCY